MLGQQCASNKIQFFFSMFYWYRSCFQVLMLPSKCDSSLIISRSCLVWYSGVVECSAHQGLVIMVMHREISCCSSITKTSSEGRIDLMFLLFVVVQDFFFSRHCKLHFFLLQCQTGLCSNNIEISDCYTYNIPDNRLFLF